MPNIKKELTKGVFWIGLAKYSGIFISLIITAILARHISPAAFGTMAIATVIMAFLDIFSDMGLGVAIVQFKNLTTRQIHSLFTISIGVAAVLTVSLFFLSDAVARFYDDQTLTSLMHWLCICLFLNSLNVVPNGLMMKNKRFRSIATRTLLFQVLSGLGACLAALNGWSVYALLIAPVVTSTGVFFFNFCNYPQRPIWPIDMEVVKRVWSYSLYQFLFNFINYFSRNADKLIIGKYLSMQALGYYEKSYRLMMMPLQNITFVITPVLHPILSSLQDCKQELAAKNLRLTTLLSQISFPLGIVLYFCAPSLIRIIFGDDWLAAIPVFQILSLSVPLQVILSTSGSLFQAAGYTNHLFYCGLQSSVCTVGAFVIAAVYFKTITAIAWAWDLALLFNFFICYIVMYRYTFRIKVKEFFSGFKSQILNSSVTVIFVLLLRKAFIPEEPFLQLIYFTLLTAVGTIFMASLLHQYTLKTVLAPIVRFLNNHRHRVFQNGDK